MDTLIQKTIFKIMKINSVQGDLTDISANTKPPPPTPTFWWIRGLCADNLHVQQLSTTASMYVQVYADVHEI